uniref:Uncharacterized protein n=1 Tax=Cannabis sativa TaxID=3483 RepID=A0A803QGL2_CANSA
MANHPQNKSSFDVAADASSLDSLSFAGLVCTQQQKLMSPSTHSHQVHKQDPEFEFSIAGQESTATDSSMCSPAHLLVSNGKLQQQAFPFQSKQRHSKTNKPHRKGSSPATSNGSKRSSDRTSAIGVSDKHKKEQKHSTSRSGIGWRLIKSFSSPCRECRAATPATPTINTQTNPRESFKLY